MHQMLVIGIGNALRGDDALGLEVARRVRLRAGADVDVHEQRGDSATLVDAWYGVERVVIVDAAVAGQAPGTIRRFDAAHTPLPASLLSASTHGFGVEYALELSRALRTLPPELVVFAVEGASFEPGLGLSEPVAAAVPEVTERVLAELTAPLPAQVLGSAEAGT
jgi:hydrogenase maturation protease